LQWIAHLPKQVCRFLEGKRPMPRTWLIIIIVAACAAVTGFLLFGGANMGH
jgi:hypothetical protein